MPLVHRGLEALEIRRFTRPLDRDWTRTSYTALARAAADHNARDPRPAALGDRPG
jgi:hypothetical protein